MIQPGKLTHFSAFINLKIKWWRCHFRPSNYEIFPGEHAPRPSLAPPIGDLASVGEFLSPPLKHAVNQGNLFYWQTWKWKSKSHLYAQWYTLQYNSRRLGPDVNARAHEQRINFLIRFSPICLVMYIHNLWGLDEKSNWQFRSWLYKVNLYC